MRSQAAHVKSHGSARHVASRSHAPLSIKRNSHNARNAILVVIVAVLLVGGAIFGWTHRPVRVEINGELYTTTVGTPLVDLPKQCGISLKPGNLISITGKVLKANEGNPFSADVDGKVLDEKQIDSYRIKGEEIIKLSDGTDTTEDFETKEETVTPKLQFEGAYGSIAYVAQWGQAGKKEVRTGKVSGETADGKTILEAQNVIVKRLNIKPQDGQKLVALTFDDGPNPTYTPKYLDILKAKHAKATFFNLGQEVAAYPEISKRCIAEGHQVASHTNSHKELTTLSADEVKSEITTAFDTLKNKAGDTTSVIRPPYGAFTDKTWLLSGGTMTQSILWTIDTNDWRRLGVDAIVNAATSGVTPGSVILMHDGGGNRDQDVEALPKIIDKLQSEGYTFVTISELMKAGGIDDAIAKGTETMPKDAIWPTEIA